MNQNLKDIIKSIFQDYSPLRDLDQQLLARDHSQGFKKLVQQKISHLTPIEQKRIESELFAWGPLTPLINQESIFDIIIQGPNTIYYEDHQGMRKHPDCFLSEISFNNFTERLMKSAQLLINQKDPFGNGKVDSFRVHMIRPPITQQTTLTLRRHRQKSFSLQDLTQQNFLNNESLEILKQIITTRKNFLIVGPTGSGKTTFLNSIIDSISNDQRLIIIEDTDEIKSTQPLACKLLSRETCPNSLNEVSMEDLVKQALRMRPDRIIVGEVRGQEAKDLLQALATGHSGSLGTLHAQSAKQALLRLEMLIQMGAPQWSLNSIRQLIQMSLGYLVVLNEGRYQKSIKEICRIGSHEKFGLLLEEVYSCKNKKAKIENPSLLRMSPF